MADDTRPVQRPTGITGGVATALPHDSARKHVSGEAVYIDDIPELPGTLMAHVLMSDRAHARIDGIDTGKAAAAPGVHAVLTAADVPGEVDIGPVFPGRPGAGGRSRRICRPGGRRRGCRDRGPGPRRR